MNVTALAILYALVACGMVAAAIVRRHRSSDVLLLGLFWPLFAPFLFLRSADPEPLPTRPAAQRDLELEHDLLEALRRASGTPLAEILPDPQTGGALARRLRTASAKLEEIDELLARPEFCANAAGDRQRQLEAAGDRRAAEFAAGRVQTIRRLGDLRDRFRRDLEAVRELVAQLRVQAEMVRLAQSYDDGTRDLVVELRSRVEGLDELIDTVH